MEKTLAVSLTNRALAEITGYNLPSVRKWVIAFLPPDPRIGQHAGVPRTHMIDESFRVFLGGKLVSQCGLTIPEAQGVLLKIVRLIETREWMPSNRTPKPEELLLAFRKTVKNTFRFTLKAVISRRPKDPPDSQNNHFIEEYELVEFGDRRSRQVGPTYELGFSPNEFVDDVREYLVDRGLELEEDPSNIPGVVRMFHPGEE